jgi:RNA polymerase sigma factor (sigma-70 family)
VFRRARTLLGDGESARDVSQEVFVRAMSSSESAGLAENPLAWLYRTTTNLCLNRLRDSKRRHEILAEWKPTQSLVDHADARVTVKKILEHVPEELMDIAVYYYVDELSHDEIAEIVGVSRRTIGNRLAAFHVRVGEFLQAEPIR